MVGKSRLGSSLSIVDGVVQIRGRVCRGGCGATTCGGWETGTDYRMRGWDVVKGKYHCIRISSRQLITRYGHL